MSFNDHARQIYDANFEAARAAGSSGPAGSLLPCPFCGNLPKVLEWANGDLVTVECAGPCLLKDVTTGRYCTKERAIEAWNTRANIKNHGRNSAQGGQNER